MRKQMNPIAFQKNDLEKTQLTPTFNWAAAQYPNVGQVKFAIREVFFGPCKTTNPKADANGLLRQ